MEHRHSIKAVALKTGLSLHVIRVWERRYEAVSPIRTDTNRRLYSAADIERLRLLRKATQAGESIGQIARMPTIELRRLVGSERSPVSVSEALKNDQAQLAAPDHYLQVCLEAVRGLDAGALESQLLKASADLSRPVLLEQVLAPMMHKVGDFWRDGTLATVHEHLASAIVRSFLGSMASYEHYSEGGPVLIATSPAGQFHEFGALMATIAAASVGWRAVYLGPNMPAEDIACAARQSGVRAVALSIVYPADDPRVKQELVKLRRMLGNDMALFIGGQGASGYLNVIESVGAVVLNDLSLFQNRLELIRSLEQTRS